MAACGFMEKWAVEELLTLRRWLLAGATVCLTACGGSGDSVFGENPRAETEDPLAWEEGVFLEKSAFQHFCANPRTGTDPFNNDQPYPDVQGTVSDENFFLRSWTYETYLWYDEVIDRDPNLFETAEYFELLKTVETTPTGNPKDNFHFSQPSEDYFRDVELGLSYGYGMSYAVGSSSPPREFRVSDVVPGSPADEAGIERGMLITAIDGADMINGNDIDTLNDGLSPDEVGELHVFAMQPFGQTEVVEFNLVSANITAVAVKDVTVVPTASGDVGYMHFNSHAQLAEDDLYDAFTELSNAGVTDLVLDLRYNPGGLLYIASEVAYMVAGSEQTQDKIFFLQMYNDKSTSFATPFYSESPGFSGELQSGTDLPSLNLSRVFILSTSGTCSASEAIINGLRGVGVEVILIGDTTCGKPYGFSPQHNCGTTYYTIQFAGANDLGFGEYPDGFSPANTPDLQGVSLPGCYVEDDYTKPFGDPEEGLFAAALQYREDQSCPSISTSNKASLGIQSNKALVEGLPVYLKTAPGLNNLIIEGP